jgi:putative DNA primase/helicase
MHPYLKIKKIKSYGLKIYGEKLLIPICDENDNLVSLQSIQQLDSGNFFKKFFPGARKKGCFFIIGDIYDEFIICEGYATGASIYECVEKPVVVAFDSGSIPDVAKAMRKKFPNAKITVAADNDQYGDAYNPGIAKAKEAAKQIGATVVIPEFKDKSTQPTDFNDLHILEGSERVREFFEKNRRNNSVEIDGFRLTDDALFYYDKYRKEYVFVSGHIKVIAQTEDEEYGKTGKLVEFKTHRGQLRQQRIHNSWIIKEGDALHQLLADVGFPISNNKKAKFKLSEYLNRSNPQEYAKFVKTGGWYGSGFLTENRFIGDQLKELVIHQSEADPSFVEANGTLEEWTEHIGKPSIGNSGLVLAISAAFASILLKPCERENFGIHFVGNSSEGKSIALFTAASVFGSHKYIRPWHSTDNGLEGMAVTHNDMLLILDEIGEMDSKKIGDAVYMLANGRGKARANIFGAAKESQTWKIGVLSSGEKDLATHMAEVNRKMYAGQGIRLLTVSAKPATGSGGILERLNGFHSYGELAEHLKKTTNKYYGTPMVAFVEKLIEERKTISQHFYSALRNAETEHLPNGINGQDDRVFKIFFTIGFAGELATKYDITGWPVGEAFSVAFGYFDNWLKDKGGFGNQEEKQILEQIRYFFSTYAQSRFQRAINGQTHNDASLNERAGYVETRTNIDGSTEDIYYVFPEYLKNVIAKGLHLKTAIKLLIDSRILEPESSEYFQARVYVNGKRQRMYLINGRIFGDEKND